MVLKSFSKINLSLSINKKFKINGLHDIQSFFCLINLYDEIKIKNTKQSKDEIKFKGKFAKYVKKNDNSIISTLRILREKNFISKYYKVLIKKNIPVFAGLGGGTSNSACIIQHLVNKKKIKVLHSKLNKNLGSDLRLFFHEQGFLDNLKSVRCFKKKYRLYFLLVYPNIKCSTKNIYSRVKKYSPKTKYNFNKIKNKRKFIDLLLSKNNDLQSIVETKYPVIKKLILQIKKNKGCYFSRITGSGSVCYGVFKSETAAKSALNRIRYKYPQYWATIAKTI